MQKVGCQTRPAATLKTLLRTNEGKCFHDRLTWETQHAGMRFWLCGTQRSHFRDREPLLSALQTLCSRWQIGQVESCGTHPRKLKFVLSPACHFCGCPCETMLHLLTTCPGTASTQTFCGILPKSRNVLAIACFDAFI